MKLRSSILLLTILCCGFAKAQEITNSQSQLLQKELARKQAALELAKQLIEEGDGFASIADVTNALLKYESAFEKLPQAPVTDKIRKDLKEKIDEAKTEFAFKLREEGKVDEAKQIATSVIEDPSATKSNQRKAEKTLKILENSRKTNQSTSPEYIENQKKIKDLLKRAKSFHDLGLLDGALDAYEQVLFIDPWNSEARKGMARVSKTKISYDRDAYKEARVFLLHKVDEEWERPIAQRNETIVVEKGADSDESLVALNLKRKAQTIKIPEVDFQGETLSDALEEIRLRSREFDDAGTGINIVVDDKPRLRNGEELGSINEEVINSLRLSNISVFDLIKVIADQFNLYPQYNDFAITLVDAETQFFTRTFRVGSGFKENLENESGGGGGGAAAFDDPFQPAPVASSGSNKTIKGLLEQATSQTFKPGESASLFGSRLVVRGSSQTLELVEVIVENLRRGEPKQVSVKTKFIEVQQNNLDELAFDWGFNTLSFDSGTQVESSGSTESSLNILGASDLSFLIRGLKQRGGADVLSAPSVVTKPNNRARIEITRQVRFPTSFAPPQIPNNIGTGITLSTGDDGTQQAATSVPVTPANPENFQVTDVGISLEVQPSIADDARTITLELSPEIVEFDGFINFGSPILSNGAIITENRIELPVFSNRKISSNLTIYDGNTVALGGLITEEVQTVEDSVPLLGDLPLIGRLFQSKTNQSIKNNLLILVTTDIIDATGSPFRLSASAQTLAN